LLVALEHGDEIPHGRRRRARGYHRILPDLDVAVPLALRTQRRRRGLTSRQVAAALGIPERRYRAFETPGKSNPTLRMLERLADVLGLDFHPKAA
jgi:DNA-binding XRE family transcriptional regulator